MPATRKHGWSKHDSSIINLVVEGFMLEPCLLQPCFHVAGNGVSTNGVTANFMCFERGNFWVLPLISSQKCQGVPFSPIYRNDLLLQRPH